MPASLVAWQEDGFARGPELDPIPGFREGALFHAAGFASDDHVGPYLRSLILDHHDSLLTPVR